MDLISLWNPPFTVQQTAQLASSVARREAIMVKLAKLVDDWAADARSM
jgi:hypothetical protein